mmetsp:Transcript_45217/g.96202  ORF Transcript_45217/g.96202 Transcript_45217/m.96202 type:complete len:90 (+) Transcript_45217:1190-1459(+)
MPRTMGRQRATTTEREKDESASSGSPTTPGVCFRRKSDDKGVEERATREDTDGRAPKIRGSGVAARCGCYILREPQPEIACVWAQFFLL